MFWSCPPALAKLGSTLLGLRSALVGLPPEGAEGAPWQREALPAAEGGAKRRPARPTEKR